MAPRAAWVPLLREDRQHAQVAPDDGGNGRHGEVHVAAGEARQHLPVASIGDAADLEAERGGHVLHREVRHGAVAGMPVGQRLWRAPCGCDQLCRRSELRPGRHRDRHDVFEHLADVVEGADAVAHIAHQVRRASDGRGRAEADRVAVGRRRGQRAETDGAGGAVTVTATTRRPSASDIASAIARPTASTPPPGAKGITISIGRAGQACAPAGTAGSVANATPSHATARIVARIVRTLSYSATTPMPRSSRPKLAYSSASRARRSARLR